MSNEEVINEARALAKGLEDREGSYSPSQLQTTAILKAAHIIADSIEKLSQPSEGSYRLLSGDPSKNSHGLT